MDNSESTLEGLVKLKSNMQFWQGKKVFLTGHTGFKGSWLSLWLQMMGAELTGFSLKPPTSPNLFDLARIEESMNSIIGDIRDFSVLQEALQRARPDIVIHMAAQPLVRYSYQEPLETYSTNVMGTANLLEAIRKTDSVKAVLNITTDKCYENKEWYWGYRESDQLGGYDPYSNSKACAELVTSAYRNSYLNQQGVGLASARAGNVIGGGDWAADRLIPDLVRACVENEAVSIRNPHALRPWQHVLEPLSGYLILTEQLYHSPLDYSEAWNFGPNDGDIKPVSWIADFVIELWNNKSSIHLDKGIHPHEATYLKLECAKAKSKLQWTPCWDIKKGIMETVSWYQAHEARENMQDITLMQIEKFMVEKFPSKN